MKIKLFILSALLLGSSAVISDDIAFRVSGIVGSTDQGFAVLIENDGNKPKLYRKGDKIRNVEIVEVAEKGIKVLFNGEERFVPLEGEYIHTEAKIVEPKPTLPATVPITISPEEIVFNLEQVSIKPGQDVHTAIKALNPVLGLPKDAEVTAINSQPVHSLGEAIDTLRKILGGKDPGSPRLDVSGVPELKEMYLIPAPPEQSDTSF